MGGKSPQLWQEKKITIWKYTQSSLFSLTMPALKGNSYNQNLITFVYQSLMSSFQHKSQVIEKQKYNLKLF